MFFLPVEAGRLIFAHRLGPDRTTRSKLLSRGRQGAVFQMPKYGLIGNKCCPVVGILC